MLYVVAHRQCSRAGIPPVPIEGCVMTQNGIRTLWAEGKPALDGWLWIGNRFSAANVAAQGDDCGTRGLPHPCCNG